MSFKHYAIVINAVNKFEPNRIDTNVETLCNDIESASIICMNANKSLCRSTETFADYVEIVIEQNKMSVDEAIAFCKKNYRMKALVVDLPTPVV